MFWLLFTVGSTRMEDPNAPGARDTTTMTELEKKGHLISKCDTSLLYVFVFRITILFAHYTTIER